MDDQKVRRPHQHFEDVAAQPEQPRAVRARRVEQPEDRVEVLRELVQPGARAVQLAEQPLPERGVELPRDAAPQRRPAPQRAFSLLQSHD